MSLRKFWKYLAGLQAKVCRYSLNSAVLLAMVALRGGLLNCIVHLLGGSVGSRLSRLCQVVFHALLLAAAVEIIPVGLELMRLRPEAHSIIGQHIARASFRVEPSHKQNDGQ